MTTLPALMSQLATIMSPLIPGAITYGAYVGIGLLKKRGYQTTYLAALTRAAAAGMAEAQAKGLNPFSTEGLTVAGQTGTNYLVKNLASAVLSYAVSNEAEHAGKVIAQVQTYQAQATADAEAARNGPNALDTLNQLVAVATGQGALPLNQGAR